MSLDRPAPGSHDRSTPSGALEESSLAIFEAMLAARDAEASGEGGRAALDSFYRTLMSGTLLLPVPPEHVLLPFHRLRRTESHHHRGARA